MQLMKVKIHLNWLNHTLFPMTKLMFILILKLFFLSFKKLIIEKAIKKTETNEVKLILLSKNFTKINPNTKVGTR